MEERIVYGSYFKNQRRAVFYDLFTCDAFGEIISFVRRGQAMKLPSMKVKIWAVSRRMGEEASKWVIRSGDDDNVS